MNMNFKILSDTDLTFEEFVELHRETGMAFEEMEGYVAHYSNGRLNMDVWVNVKESDKISISEKFPKLSQMEGWVLVQ